MNQKMLLVEECEKLGAELIDIEEHCHYWLKIK